MFIRWACEVCRALSPRRPGAPAPVATSHLFTARVCVQTSLFSSLCFPLASLSLFKLDLHSPFPLCWHQRLECQESLSAHSHIFVAWAQGCGRFYLGFLTYEGYNCLVFDMSVLSLSFSDMATYLPCTSVWEKLCKKKKKKVNVWTESLTHLHFGITLNLNYDELQAVVSFFVDWCA